METWQQGGHFDSFVSCWGCWWRKASWICFGIWSHPRRIWDQGLPAAAHWRLHTRFHFIGDYLNITTSFKVYRFCWIHTALSHICTRTAETKYKLKAIHWPFVHCNFASWENRLVNDCFWIFHIFYCFFAQIERSLTKGGRTAGGRWKRVVGGNGREQTAVGT